jgi:hypothetical protein
MRISFSGATLAASNGDLRLDGESHYIAGLAIGAGWGGAGWDQRAVRSGSRAITVTVISVTPCDGENGQPTPMSVESIFQQLHNPTTWPAPPERSLQPYSADLRPSPMPVETLWFAVHGERNGSRANRLHGRAG